jgi:NAD-dependent dihydropyrimidine dehydrogenase PreA subunit
VPHKAIGLEVVEVLDGQGHPVTIQRPTVVRELCIGCGICEYQCPMGGESAIRVDTLTEAGVYLGATVGEGHQGLHGQGRGHGGSGQ